MAFHGSQVCKEEIPFIVYIHSDGFREVFNKNHESVFDYLRETLPTIKKEIREERLTPEDPKYGIAVIWANSSSRVRSVGTFVYGNLNTWQENPDVVGRMFRERIPVSSANQVIGCGDVMIMLGIEERARRTTRDLEQYLSDNTRAIVQMQLSESGLWVPEGARR